MTLPDIKKKNKGFNGSLWGLAWTEVKIKQNEVSVGIIILLASLSTKQLWLQLDTNFK